MIVVLASGCAGTGQSMGTWAAHQGGVEIGFLQQRTERAGHAVLSECSGRRVTVHVLANDALTAFSWPNGHVFVTRGLVNTLTDAELSAAIAHELGHLLSDGHLASVVSLKGCSTDADAEERADALGAQLLRAHHISTRAMISMLKKVRDHGGLPPICRHAVDRRIELLAERYP